MFKFNPNTPIKYYTKETAYISGKGNQTVWKQIISGTYDTFYGEWKGTYGDRAMSAEALGIKESATIRTFYNPNIYNKLRTVKVLVVKKCGYYSTHKWRAR